MTKLEEFGDRVGLDLCRENIERVWDGICMMLFWISVGMIAGLAFGWNHDWRGLAPIIAVGFGLQVLRSFWYALRMAWSQ